MTIGEEGVHLAHESQTRFLNWGEIREAITNGDCGYVYISSEHALIIPQRCFSDENAFGIFMKMAVIYHWNAQKAASEAPEPVPHVEAAQQHTVTSSSSFVPSQPPIAMVAR